MAHAAVQMIEHHPVPQEQVVDGRPQTGAATVWTVTETLCKVYLT